MKKGKLLFFLGAAALSYSLLPTAICRGKALLPREQQNEKIIYLTFDDGPGEYTSLLLDLLKRHDVKASFFTVATAAEAHPDLIRRMKEEGHLIASHSLEHKNPLWQMPKKTELDFLLSAKIMDSLGVPLRYYRPPWGCFNLKTLLCLKGHGYEPVLWQVMAEDWRSDTTACEIGEKLLKRTKNGDIVCLHDGRGAIDSPLRTIGALEMVLPLWQKEGFRFLTVDKI